jgi:Tfp pilus assembly protein PilN
VDVAPGELRIARAERRFGTTRLVGLDRVPCASGGARRAALASALGGRAHEVIAALPVAELAHRVLSLPFRDARRIAETVSLELLGQLPSDPGDVAVGHVAIGAAPDGTRVLAALVRRARVASIGLDAARVEAALVGAPRLVDGDGDVAIVLADGARSAIVVRRDGELVGLRALASHPLRDGEAFAREVRWTLVALGGSTRLVVTGADSDDDLRRQVARTTGAPVTSLAAVAATSWRDDALDACAVAAGLIAGPGLVLERPARQVGSARRVAVLAAAAAVLAVVDVGIVRWQLVRQDEALAEAVRATAAAALPAGTRIVAPRAQLEAAAGTLAGRPASPASVLALLRELSQRVPSDVGLELDELVLDGDVVRLHGRTDRFESIDVVTRALGASAGLRDVTAEDSRAAVDGRGVEFGLRATWRPTAGAPS